LWQYLFFHRRSEPQWRLYLLIACSFKTSANDFDFAQKDNNEIYNLANDDSTSKRAKVILSEQQLSMW